MYLPNADGVPSRPGPAEGEPDSHAFTFHISHASHALPCAPNRLTAPLVSGRGKGDAYRVRFPCTAAFAMHHKAREGPTAAAVRIKVQHCAIPYGSPRCRRARSKASLHRPDRPGTRGGRSPHAGDERKTEAAPEAVSDRLRRHAGR